MANVLANTTLLIVNRWQIKKKIGTGAFGSVYAVRDIFTDVDTAAKFEPVDRSTSRLEHEFQVYNKLQSRGTHTAPVGVSRVYYYGCFQGFLNNHI